jgi:hypothetical protein
MVVVTPSAPNLRGGSTWSASKKCHHWWMKRTFSVAARLPSFLYAGRGVKTLLASQHDAWIHGAATVLVVAGGIAAKLTRFEWLALGYFMA